MRVQKACVFVRWHARVFDAINGVVWHDDTQVADLQVRRRYGAQPGVSMVVMALEAG